MILLGSQRLLSQDIRISTKIAKAVLKDLADLDRLRADYKTDSVVIAKLTLAYTYKNEALQKSIRAGIEADRIAQDYHHLYVISDIEVGLQKKEVKRQTFLKWIGFGVAGLVVILSAL